MARTKQQVVQNRRTLDTSGKKPRKQFAIVKKVAPVKITPKGGGIKKAHRFRPGTVALRQIRKYQKSTDLLCRKLPFIRLVREIAQEEGTGEWRFSAAALASLQEAAESFLIGLLEDTNRTAITCKKVTIMPNHMRLVLELRDSSVARKHDTEAQNNYLEAATKAAIAAAKAKAKKAQQKSALAPDDVGDDASLVDGAK